MSQKESTSNSTTVTLPKTRLAAIANEFKLCWNCFMEPTHFWKWIRLTKILAHFVNYLSAAVTEALYLPRLMSQHHNNHVAHEMSDRKTLSGWEEAVLRGQHAGWGSTSLLQKREGVREKEQLVPGHEYCEDWTRYTLFIITAEHQVIWT